MNELLLFSSVVSAGLSLLLFVISAISFQRIREPKLLFISIALLLFFFKNVIAIIYDILTYLVLVDLVIIFMLYLAAARK